VSVIDQLNDMPTGEQGQDAKPNGHGTAPSPLAQFRQLTEPKTARRYLVKGIIDRNALVVLYGAPGCGKTFLVLDLALTIAAGRERWFDHRVKGGRCVYIAAEAGEGIRNRVAAWAQARWNGNDDLDFEALMIPPDLMKPEHVKRLIEIIGKADLIVIDTLSRAAPSADENTGKDMNQIIDAVKRLQREIGCTVICIHHTGKDESRGPRGWSGVTGAVDTEIHIVRDGDISTVTAVKQRDMADGGTFNFKLHQVTLGIDEDGDDVTSCIVDLSDPPPPKMPSGKARAAFDILVRLAADRNSDRVPDNEWRMAIVASAEFGQSSNPNQDHKRMRDRLQRDRVITIDGEMVVITPVLPF
jgi:KaiC/GvpD/RAD55 family RecA-like ATPase